MSLQRILIYFTSFGGTFFLMLSQKTGNMYFVFVGAVILLAGFSYILKLSRQAKPAEETVEA